MPCQSFWTCRDLLIPSSPSHSAPLLIRRGWGIFVYHRLRPLENETAPVSALTLDEGLATIQVLVGVMTDV